MLKEVYVMVNGVDIFHYAATDQDDSDFVLTSGFFSALQSFSQEVRSSKIDFFSSETEIFMFDDFNEHEDTSIVIIFDNDIQQNVAREVLKQVKNIVLQSDLFDLPDSVTLDQTSENRLRSKIYDVSMSLISIEFQIKAAKELIESVPYIDFMLMYNYYKDDINFKYTEGIIDFEKEDQLKTLRAISRYLIPLIKDYNIGTNFDLVTIETYDNIMLISKNGTDYTVIISQDPDEPKAVYDLPFQLMSQPSFEYFRAKYNNLSLNTQFQIDSEYNIQFPAGVSRIYYDTDSLVKTIKSINRLLDSFNLDQFHEITIYPEEQSMGFLRITRNYTKALNTIEIFKA